VCIVDAKEKDLFKFALRRVLLGCGIRLKICLILQRIKQQFNNLMLPAAGTSAQPCFTMLAVAAAAGRIK
jgi:hypothetical protein